MAFTLANIRTAIQALIGDESSTSQTEIDRYINMAGRDVWSAWAWPERQAETWINTVAPYETGTVTLTNGAKTVAGVGTTFPSDSGTLPRRIALSYTEPWYVIDGYGGATSMTLVEDYGGETIAGTGYALYCDRFSMPSTVERIQSVMLHQSGYTNPRLIIQARMDELAALPLYSSTPLRWAFDGLDGSGYLAIRLSPVPDAVYRLHVRYLTAYTELVNDGDTPVLVERRRDLIMARALEYAYRLRTNHQAAGVQLALYQRLLAEAINNERPADSVVRFRGFDEQPYVPLINYRFPAEA